MPSCYFFHSIIDLPHRLLLFVFFTSSCPFLTHTYPSSLCLPNPLLLIIINILLVLIPALFQGLLPRHTKTECSAETSINHHNDHNKTRATYSFHQAFQRGILQHEGIEHLLCFLSHVQENCVVEK